MGLSYQNRNAPRGACTNRTVLKNKKQGIRADLTVIGKPLRNINSSVN
jgi:hypothetical protein